MRRIKITNSLRKEVKDFNHELFVFKGRTGFVHPINKLKTLSKKIKTRDKNYKAYIDKIIKDYADILNADPIKMESLIKEFECILPSEQLTKKLPSAKFSFHEEIVKALRYEDLRALEFPKYLLNSNIRTCVYCNAQSTLTIEPIYYNKKKKKKRRKVVSKLQLDHYHPKSKYPFLCTSFFNLYPTCANCNLAKGNDKALFELYTLGDDLDVFHFDFDDKSILDYWLSLDIKSLKVQLSSLDGNHKLLENHNELFQIQKVYDAQKDIGEELVWKARANPQVYRNQLNTSFRKIFPDPSIIDRMIIGNYSKPEETFKRPMAKYTQDLARALKLI